MKVNLNFIKKNKLVFAMTLSFLGFWIFVCLSWYYPYNLDFSDQHVAKYSLLSVHNITYVDKEKQRLFNMYLDYSIPYYYKTNPKAFLHFNENLDTFLHLISENRFQELFSYAKSHNIFIDPIFLLDWKPLASQMIFFKGNLINFYKNFMRNYYIVDFMESHIPSKIILLGNDFTSIQSINSLNIRSYPISVPEIENLIKTYNTNIPENFYRPLSELLASLLKPTIVKDLDYRQKIIDRKKDSLSFEKAIFKNTIILKKADMLKEDEYLLARFYLHNHRQQAHKRILLYTIYALLMYIFTIQMMQKGFKRTFSFQRNNVITFVTFVFVNFLYFISVILSNVLLLPGYLLVAMGIPVLILPFLIRNQKVATVILFSCSLFYIFYPGSTLDGLVFLFALSAFSFFVPIIIKRREHFVKASLYLLLGYLTCYLLIYLIYTNNFFDKLNFGYSFTSGHTGLFSYNIIVYFSIALFSSFGCGIIAVGILPIIEKVWNIPTHFKLLELSNPNTSKVLQNLKINAPGTYNHSLLLGDMCSEAARIIHLDPLLVRVGCYYHDIGKAERPEYFVENQEGKNKHNTLAPTVSASMIKGHVSNGVRLALEYKLPTELIEYITQHHGTTTVSYFYHRAKNLYGENVNKQDYLYGGPIPQSKGTAILLLADAIEAVVRAHSQDHKDVFSIDSIKNIIDEMTDKRMREHQLDQCDLTIKEISLIKESFAKSLVAYYHKRIKYYKL